MSRETAWLIGTFIVILGMIGRGILQNRILGVNTNDAQQLLAVLELSGGMAAASVAILLEAMESCAAPIFAILLVDGFQKSKNSRNYLLRILVVALVSEIPYDYAMTGRFLNFSVQNPMFSLVLALILLLFYNYYGAPSVKNTLIKLIVTVTAFLWVLLLRIEYGTIMLAIVAALWLFRNYPTLRFIPAATAAIVCCVGRPLYMFSPFGFILVYFYNGEEGNLNRELRYAIFPIALVLIGLAGALLF